MQIKYRRNIPSIIKRNKTMQIIVSVFIMIFALNCAKSFDVSLFDTDDQRKQVSPPVDGVDYHFLESSTTFPDTITNLTGLNVSTYIKNNGRTDGTGSIQVSLYLSKTDSIDPNSTLLKTISISYTIYALSLSEHVSLGFNLAQNLDNGMYYSILKLTSEVPGEVLSNNIYVLPRANINIAGRTDIVIQTVAKQTLNYFIASGSVDNCLPTSSEKIYVESVIKSPLEIFPLGSKSHEVFLNSCNGFNITIDLSTYGFTPESGQLYTVEFFVDNSNLIPEINGANNYFGPFSLNN